MLIVAEFACWLELGEFWVLWLSGQCHMGYKLFLWQQHDMERQHKVPRLLSNTGLLLVGGQQWTHKGVGLVRCVCCAGARVDVIRPSRYNAPAVLQLLRHITQATTTSKQLQLVQRPQRLSYHKNTAQGHTQQLLSQHVKPLMKPSTALAAKPA